MKKVLIYVVLLFLGGNAFSQAVSIAEARKAVSEVIADRISQLSNDKFDVASATTVYRGDVAVYHIFNLKPEGFVIIAGDRRVEPLLAFSHTSEFAPDGANAAAKWWVDNYADQIEFCIAKDISPSPEVTTHWDRLLHTDSHKSAAKTPTTQPLLHTRWAQGKYYNAACPADNDGPDDKVLAGCVAIALAQLMNYFRYPQMGTGNYTYEHPDYGELSVDFSQERYNYNVMPDKAVDYCDDMARLIYDVGVSVDMDFGPHGSGMNNHKAAYTLRTFFGYDESATYLYKDSLPADFDWNGTLVNHLNRRIPLYYAGWSDRDYVSGHAFILDAYSDSTHYHVNWGWGGSQDGYFLIDNLSPQGNDFTLCHEVVVNAIPANEPAYCADNQTITTMTAVVEDGSGPLSDYANNSECTWLIAPDDSVSGIELDFLRFCLDPNDVLMGYDGDNDEAPLLFAFSGNDTVDTVVGTASQLLLKFITNGDSVSDGWMIKFTGLQPEYCTREAVYYRSSCDTISDGSNNRLYHNNSNCTWKIEPEAPANNIVISFLEFDLEPTKDFLKIYRPDNTLVAKLTGSELPSPVTVPDNKAKLKFITNASGRHNGFKLMYTTTTTDVSDCKSTSYVHPNPANDLLIIGHLPSAPTEISIFSTDGRLCRKFEKSSGSEVSIDVSSLESGIYIIEMKSDGKIERAKFVKR